MTRRYFAAGLAALGSAFGVRALASPSHGPEPIEYRLVWRWGDMAYIASGTRSTRLDAEIWAGSLITLASSGAMIPYEIPYQVPQHLKAGKVVTLDIEGIPAAKWKRVSRVEVRL